MTLFTFTMWTIAIPCSGVKTRSLLQYKWKKYELMGQSINYTVMSETHTHFIRLQRYRAVMCSCVYVTCCVLWYCTYVGGLPVLISECLNNQCQSRTVLLRLLNHCAHSFCITHFSLHSQQHPDLEPLALCVFGDVQYCNTLHLWNGDTSCVLYLIRSGKGSESLQSHMSLAMVIVQVACKDFIVNFNKRAAYM